MVDYLSNESLLSIKRIRLQSFLIAWRDHDWVLLRDCQVVPVC